MMTVNAAPPRPRRSDARKILRGHLSLIVLGLGCLACGGGLDGSARPGAEEATSASSLPPRSAETPRPAALEPGIASVFDTLTESAGLDFQHRNGMSGERWFVEMMGAGLGLIDYDRDGDLDIYFLQGRPLTDGAEEAWPSDRLYRNDLTMGPDGEPRLGFVDVTETSGIAATGYGMGVTAGDVNGDGWPDLYITNWGANQLWINTGQGAFVDRSDRIDNPIDGWSTSAAMFDFDRDGWLDIMVTNYVRYSLAQDHACYASQSGQRDYCSPSAYPPAADVLLHNRGDGSFEDVTYAMGMAGTFGPGLGVSVGDFDNDGWPDVYVANDGADNQLWMNQGGERFEDRAPMAGAAVNQSGAPEASMGVAAADFDNDADLDLFMTHLQSESNTLYVNDGQGQFEDASQRAGLAQASIAFTSFGTSTLDFDNDGWQDLAIVNGLVIMDPEQSEAGDPLPLRQRDQLFRNLGAGGFEEVTARAGPAFAEPSIGRGLAAGDLDNDGDTDLVVSHNDGPARLLLNRIGAEQDWLGLDLRLSEGGREAYGAQVALLAGERVVAMQQVQPSGSYCSSNDPRLRFGLASIDRFDSLRVRWPDGAVERWPAPASQRYHSLIQGQGQAEKSP